MVAAGAAMATGAWGRAPRLTVRRGTSRVDVERFLEQKRLWIIEQQMRQVPRLCLDPSAVSESEARTAAQNSFQRWPRSRASASASNTAGSVSEGNVPSGARALHAARSPSTGGWCSRRPKCSTTWSCTSSVTCASQTTHGGSGRSSSDTARTGANNAIGCAITGLNSWHSDRTAHPAGMPVIAAVPARATHSADEAGRAADPMWSRKTTRVRLPRRPFPAVRRRAARGIALRPVQ